ncbi:MAG: hypothetical protein AB8F34_09900 [Akkermansiaceae bacterium]
MSETHSNATMAATRHLHVISTGALSEERRPITVVAAKMTTSRCSWKNGLMWEIAKSLDDLKAPFT